MRAIKASNKLPKASVHLYMSRRVVRKLIAACVHHACPAQTWSNCSFIYLQLSLINFAIGNLGLHSRYELKQFGFITHVL